LTEPPYYVYTYSYVARRIHFSFVVPEWVAGSGGRLMLSLSARIRGDIQQRIVSGALAPGTRIPFEQELANQYGCARMTVNKALVGLAEDGLIVRRRKAGSFVATPAAERSVMAIQDFSTEATRAGLPYRHEITTRRLERLSPQAAREAGLPCGPQVLHVCCRHIVGARPVAYEDRVISLTAVPDAADEMFCDVAPGTWLLRRVPWSQAEHTLRARRADAELVRLLSVELGEACLVLRRRTWREGAPGLPREGAPGLAREGAPGLPREGAPVTSVEITYAGERETLVGRFAPCL
jgi:GntR family histidine utilization transcriptional repressor